jgi:hypothetical protein
MFPGLGQLEVDIYTSMFTGCIIYNSQNMNTSKCPSTGELINKMWHIHRIECYAALKRKEILMPGTMWIDLEDMMAQ